MKFDLNKCTGANHAHYAHTAAMPTVLSVTLALGAFKLAQKGAIVSRLTAIEELAGMTMLCSDKTGTLTLNQVWTAQQCVWVLYSSE